MMMRWLLSTSIGILSERVSDWQMMCDVLHQNYQLSERIMTGPVYMARFDICKHRARAFNGFI